MTVSVDAHWHQTWLSEYVVVTQINHRDVIALLNALGPVGDRAFGSIRSQWRGTRCEQVPDPESAGKLKTQFVFQFSGLPLNSLLSRNCGFIT